MNTIDYNLLGNYGPSHTKLSNYGTKELSFLHSKWRDPEEWRSAAREKFLHYTAPLEIKLPLSVRTRESFDFDGLAVEKLEWETGFGPQTEAVFMKPADSSGRLAGVLALHDHGGVKYFGKSKIIRLSDSPHPFLREHQDVYYSGLAWANELAKRGYGVLVHDVFPFESRKIIPSRLPGYALRRMMSDPEDIEELTPEDLRDKRPNPYYDVSEKESTEEIKRYNAFAGEHEHVIAKSLFSSGLTWPGIFLAEDRCALSYLASREDIDPSRLGCGGLSGGGLRTNYLAGVDDRIACSVTAGFLTSWQDLALNTAYTHTWMIYIPLLAKYLEQADILGMRVPKATMVLATRDDPLFSLEEVEKTGGHLEKIYAKAGYSRNFRMKYYDGPHKFDQTMQKDAFAWFDSYLKK